MEEMLFPELGWPLKKFIVVRKKALILKVEKNDWRINFLGQRMVDLMWKNPTNNIMMSRVIVKKSMKPMLEWRIWLNPNSRDQYVSVYQIQVIIVPPTKLISHCLRTNDDEDKHERNSLNSQSYQTTLNKNFGSEDSQIQHFNTSVIKSSLIMRMMRMNRMST